MNRKERKKLQKAVDRVLEATVADLAAVGWTIEIVQKANTKRREYEN